MSDLWMQSLHAGYRAAGAAATLTPSELDAHVAELGVELERVHAALAPDSRLLHTTEGCAQIAQIPAVHPDDAGFDLRRDAMRALQIGGPYRRREPVVGVVGEPHGFVFAVEGGDVAARPEDLFAHDG